jgi:adenylate cyclase
MPRPRPRWETLVALGVALLALLALRTIAETGLPGRLENLSLDARFRLRPARPKPGPIVIVGVDDASIAELGRWPWSRTLFARLLDRVSAGNAKVVAFDLLFTEPQAPLSAPERAIETALAPLVEKLEPAQRGEFAAALEKLRRDDGPDAEFARALAAHRPAILAFAIDLGQGDAGRTAPPLPAALEKQAYPRVRGAGPDHLPEPSGLRVPIAPLAGAGSLGHVSVVADAAGAYRYDYPVLRYDDFYFPSLSLEAARAYLGIAKDNVIIDIGRGIDLESLHVPLDDGMRLVVNYYPPRTFRWVSFADVLSGRIAPETFAGKIVLVGASATGVGDFAPSPFTPALPGVERHATLLENILGSDFLRRGRGAVALDELMIVLGGVAIAVASRWGASATGAAAAAMLAALSLVDFEAFVDRGLWLDFTIPAASFALTGVGVIGGQYAIRWRRERWIRGAFSRYLHPDMVEELSRSRESPRLGGEERELTVLFLDVREFTALAETLTATELVATMNELFAAMTDVVLKNRGMIDKYIGDSLMAVFGAPLPDPRHAARACRAALDMRAALASLNARWRAKGRPSLDIRVGVNSGRMVIGNVGGERRFDYTVMGDEVNVASRLEAACKALGADILVSEATKQAANGEFTFSARGAISVKGRKQPVSVFEVS